jgi:hypothetical protein
MNIDHRAVVGVAKVVTDNLDIIEGLHQLYFVLLLFFFVFLVDRETLKANVEMVGELDMMRGISLVTEKDLPKCMVVFRNHTASR